MIEPCGLNSHPVHIEAAVFNVAKLTSGAHLVHIHGKVGRFHLLGHDLLEVGLAAGGMKKELSVGAVVKGTEEGDALNVIPVKVGDEDVGGKGAVAELALEFASEDTETGAAIKDVNLIVDAHFHAGGIASVAEILGLWSGRGPAHAPKLNLHSAPVIRPQ